MFHIGKVEKVVLAKGKNVVSSDTSIQAMVKMWDDNLLILQVDKKIAGQLKENDYVLADYTPVAPDSPHRKMVIMKIVRGELAKSIWKGFEKEFEKKKQKPEGAKEQQMPMPYIR